MVRDPGASIKRLRARIEAREDGLSEDDADALLRMSDELYLRQSDYSDQRHRFHLVHNRKIAEQHGELAAALESKAAAERIVTWINQEYENAETNKDYRTAIRMFGELATPGDEKPDSINWIPSGYPSNYDPAPDPGKMLLWSEDIKPMLDACRNYRDKALITLAWDLGPRPFELRDLTVDAISDHDYGKRVTVQGKKGQRSPIIIPSVPYVKQWLDVHPDPSAGTPLWTRLNSPEAVSYAMLLKIPREAAKRAAVTKPVTPSNFRKSSASYLASEGVPQAHLEEHHGWKRGSKVASRYISVFGEAADREIARVHGVDVGDDEGQPVGPIVCTRCEQKTPRDEDLCMWCGAATNQRAASQAKQADSDIVDLIANADPELATQLADFREEIGNHPILRAALLPSDD